MTAMPTATELLTEMRPAWGAALGGRVSPEYLAAFIGRHQRRLESALEPIAAALAAVPTVNVYELAEDVARRLRGLSEIANALANTSDNFGIELDRQLPKVMLEYLPTLTGGQSQGAGTPERWAIYRRWSDDSAFRRKLREQVYELLWDRRPGWSTSDAAEIEEARAEKEKEARTQLQSTRLRNAAAKIAERRVKVAADSIALLRRQDVERVLNETPSAERRQVAYVLGERRPELVDEIDEVMREVLGEPANWSTYGRDEIYQPGSRARREATLADEDPADPDFAAVLQLVRGRRGYFEGGGHGSSGDMTDHEAALRLWNAGFRSHMDLVDDGRPLLRAAGHDVSTPREREAWDYKPASEPTQAESAVLDQVIEVVEPSADKAERELAALAAEDGKPRPVVMASLEAGGVIMLRPFSYLGKGSDLFQTYRDATSRLQYVSYPKKGNRGIPSKVARAVLALERDGFEVRAEDPEVIKSLIDSGGLDHALAVGPPPPREAAARPNTRTSDPALIARVEAMAADPPTSTIKYLAKVLRLNGSLPLQVIDWQNGGKRTLESALEEGEAKVARKLARRPKAERLRDDGVERPARNANEEHAAQALVQLADMDPDKAHEVNEAGFSKSDVNTGHTLARRWEATGELTGDEWAWAVEVANKYRRQVGPLPESPAKAKRPRQQPVPVEYDGSRYTNAHGPNVEQILVQATKIVRGSIPAQVRAELRAAVAAGALGHLKKDGLKPEVFFHPDHRHGAIELQRREAEYAIANIASVVATPDDIRMGMETLGEDVLQTALARSSKSHGDGLATLDGVVSVLKRNLAKLYASYKLEIHATRAIGDNSVTITFYRVPPNADDLEAANAKSKVRINIHGEGRGNEPTWSGDQTPARLTAYTVWDVNAPKFRKRSGPIQAIVTAVVDWFVLHAPQLMGEPGAAPPVDTRKMRPWSFEA